MTSADSCITVELSCRNQTVESRKLGLQTGDRGCPFGYVMEQLNYYEALGEPKVMVICIDWDAPTESGIQIHNAFMTYTTASSDSLIFANELAQNSKYSCKKMAKSENINCTFQMLNNNGKNILKAPLEK